jgi:hypothetical protein
LSAAEQPAGRADPQRPLAGDRPIESPEQDTIGRAGFALQIQREIETAPRDEGLVLAVTGGWGSGKTSVINLALLPLEARSGYRIVRFNPWLFSGTPQLVEHFFAELRAQLKASGNDRLKEIGEALEQYGDAIDPLRFIPGADKAAAVSRFLGKIFKGPQYNIARQRHQLDALLARHDELLVIVVDDIDRLHDQEVADVMRLVRLVADFPNTAYLLAFDAGRVASAVDPRDPKDGHAYVEKIVQVSHDIPAISSEQLSQMLLERIDTALDGIPYKLDPQRWSALYLIFRRYLRSLRDVSRYANHIRSPMWLLADEIEAADVLGLEALRLFEHSFWAELPTLTNDLTSGEKPNLFSQERAADADRLKRLVDEAVEPPTLRELLVQLFPAASKRLGSSMFGGAPQDTWRHERRVADPSVLQIYLSKQIQPTEAPTAVVERFVRALSDPQTLREELHKLNDSQVADLLSRLEDFEGNYPDELAPAIPVLYETVGRLPRAGRMFDIEPRMRVSRVVLRMLRGHSRERVSAIVAQALHDLDQLSDRWSLIGLVGYEQGSGHELVEEDFAKAWTDELVQAVLRAPPHQLVGEADLMRLLWVVERHDPEGAHELARKGVLDASFVMALLRSYVHEVRSDAGRHLQLEWDRLSALVGEELLIQRVSQLPDPTEPADADQAEILAQARRYAADPDRARTDLEEYRKRYGG